MYQQTNDNQKVTSTGDLILVIVLIAIIVFIKKISNFLTSLGPVGTYLMVVLALFLVAAIYFIYRKRLCSYRYTLFYQDPPEGELDEYGQPAKQPYPLGTVLFERMTGGKGRLYEALKPEDIVALLEPGEKYSEKIGFFNMARLTVYSAKTAHTLVFRRKGKLFGIYFHPTAEFLECLAKSPVNVEVRLPEKPAEQPAASDGGNGSL